MSGQTLETRHKVQIYNSAIVCVCIPGDAEQVVQGGAELLHAGLVWTQRDGQDQTAAPVFAP